MRVVRAMAGIRCPDMPAHVTSTVALQGCVSRRRLTRSTMQASQEVPKSNAAPTSTTTTTVPPIDNVAYGGGGRSVGGPAVVGDRTTKVTLPEIAAMHRKGEKIAMLTAYDCTTARLAEKAGVELVLVGDSLGMVMMGRDTTVGVSLEEIRHHCEAVVAGCQMPLVVADLPFGSYITPEDAARNAAWLLTHAGADVVKLEGGRRVVPQIEAMVNAGIAVVGHIGLTPQSYTTLGGFRCQGKSATAALQLVDDALALQEAGCFAVIIECIPTQLASYITDLMTIPTIGIGAGPYTSGQVMVSNDILGLSSKRPKFSRMFKNVGAMVETAISDYVATVKDGSFPAFEHTFNMSRNQLSKFSHLLADERKNLPELPAVESDDPMPGTVPRPRMSVFHSIGEVRNFRAALDGRVGIVPTMGGLHQGHLDLVKAAQEICDSVVVSLFVNPTQFAAHEDLDSYPRQLVADLEMLEKAGVDAVFTPNASEMYPENSTTFVNLDGIDDISEGARRPGFFRGVATICTKLFNIVQPDTAFFGQKDALQCTVIRRMVTDMNMPINILIVPTTREPDGLAMSTRNQFLSVEQRAAAPTLYKALTDASIAYETHDRTVTSSELISIVEDKLSNGPFAHVEYVSVADPLTGMTTETVEDGFILSCAVRFENNDDGLNGVRLLDNIVLTKEKIELINEVP